MISKTHKKGDRVIIKPEGGPYSGQKGTIFSNYGKYTALGYYFWGYFVMLDSGIMIGISRRLLTLEKVEIPKLNRGDLDQKVAWKDCPWQPQGI